MINVHLVNPSDISKLSARDINYMQNPGTFQDFIAYPPNLHVFREVLQQRKSIGTNRHLLVEALASQITGYNSELQEKVLPLIEVLKDEQTFTVITAHQPVLFSGPMYVFFKAISAVVLARQIQADNPGYKIQPVFVLGAEDHDYEEINHLHLWGQRIKWNHSNANGPVGLLSKDGISEVINEIKEKVTNTPHGEKLISAMLQAVESADDFGGLSQAFLQQLLVDLGVLVVQMNHPALKKQFVTYMLDDVFENTSNKVVSPTIEKIQAELGYSAQAMPRNINLFYMEPGKRWRIEKDNNGYYTVDGDKRWNATLLKNAITNNPENFSPNVILRPLYQELIFPNLAYVGGGGEIAYWLERKAQFDHYGIPFPALVRRDSAFFLDKPLLRRIEKLQLKTADLWKDKDSLMKERILKQSDQEISTTAEKSEIASVFSRILEKAVAIDPTLERPVLAEMTKALNSIEIIEKKMIRSEKKNQELFVQQVEYIFERLFPENTMQERYESFISFYAMYGKDILENLCDIFNPLDSKVKVIEL